MRINHLIDPTYFDDAIEEFSFDYKCYFTTDIETDEDFKETRKFESTIIRGSLQSKGRRRSQSDSGNRETWEYDFYCKSCYRLNPGDFIKYNNKMLIVKDVQDYDEYGVREASLESIDISNYQDLEEFIEYEEGLRLR